MQTFISRNFYKSGKAMRMRDETYDPTTIINDKNGNPINDKKDIKTRWKEYFNEQSNNTQRNPHNQSQFDPSFKYNDKEPIILRSEVQQAIKTSPKNKSPGIDGAATEAILASWEIGVTWLTSIFQKAWMEKKVSDDWQWAVIVPIWKKKGSKRDCGMYRGISLLSHVGKMYAKVLEQRTRYKVEPFLSQAQMGFRKGRGCTVAIFNLRQLSEKVTEHDRELNIVFVDQEKAFGRVNRNKLWQTLELYNIQGQLLDNSRAIYANSMSAERTSGGLTD